jgi:hypothetical protein
LAGFFFEGVFVGILGSLVSFIFVLLESGTGYPFSSFPFDSCIKLFFGEVLLVKQVKTCERNIQELIDSIKRPNKRIMGIEEGKEVKVKGMHNIFNKIITENFPNLEKVMPI